MSHRRDLPSTTAPNFLARVREELQRLMGTRGDPNDRSLTVGDMGGSTGGVFGWIKGQQDADKDLTPPPTPTGFHLEAGLANVLVECDPPLFTMGRGPGATVLYGVKRTPGGLAPTFASAVRLAEFPGSVYAYATDPSTTWNMWITWRTLNGVESAVPAGGVNGLEITTGQDPSSLLQALQGAINETELAQDLAGQINDSTDGVAYLGTQYGVRVQVAGDGKTLAGGYGVMGRNDAEHGPQIDFGVAANTFWVGAPSDTGLPTVQPFIVRTTPSVENGVTFDPGVYMDAAYIVNLTALWGKFGTLVADSIHAADLDAAHLTLGDGTVGGPLKSTNFVSGTQGWRLMPDGTAELSNAVVRGTVYASSGEFYGGVYASYGEFVGKITAQSGTIANMNLTAGGINSGGFTGYAWPPAGQAGVHLSAAGLLAGNANNGSYFQIEASTGNVYAPGLTIVNGSAIFAGTITAASGVFVNTVNVAGNAITVPIGYYGDQNTTGSPWLIGRLYLPDYGGGQWALVATAVLNPTSNGAQANFEFGIDGGTSFAIPVSFPVSGWGSTGGTKFDPPSVYPLGYKQGFASANLNAWVGAGSHYVDVRNSASTGGYCYITAILCRR